MRERDDTLIGDVLIDQRVMAGAGNVYKPEVLFARRISLFASVRSLSDEQLRAVASTARTLLKRNVADTKGGQGSRRTVGRLDPAARLSVYDRRGAPCRIGGAPIAHRRHGPDARSAYWCPRCQPAPRGPLG